MSDDLDYELDALVAAANPVPHPDRTAPSPVHLAGAVVAARRRRRTRLLAPAAVAAIGLSAAATYALLPAGTHQPLTVSCAAYLNDEVTTGVVADGRGPTQECARVWARGQMIAGQRSVPPLQACVHGDQVTVYPAADACSKLRRAPFAGYSGSQTTAITVNAGLTDFQNKHGCTSPAALAALARDQLNRAGLGAWKITNTAGSARCASAYLDSGNRRVVVQR